MKITLDIPDGILCGFFNGVQRIRRHPLLWKWFFMI